MTIDRAKLSACLVAALMAVGCNDSTTTPSPEVRCGNSVCETGETQAACPADCTPVVGQVCGNGTCEGSENGSSCASDCASVDEIAGVWAYCGWSDSDPDAATGCAGRVPSADRVVYDGNTILHANDDGSCNRRTIDDSTGVLLESECIDGTYEYGYEQEVSSLSPSGDYLTRTYTDDDGSKEYEFFVRISGETLASVSASCTDIDDRTCSTIPTISSGVDSSLSGTWQSCEGEDEADPAVACTTTSSSWLVFASDGTGLEIYDDGVDSDCEMYDYASGGGTKPFVEFQYCDGSERGLYGAYTTVTMSGGATYLTMASEEVECVAGGGCSTTVYYDHYVAAAAKSCPVDVTVGDYTCP